MCHLKLIAVQQFTREPLCFQELVLQVNQNDTMIVKTEADFIKHRRLSNKKCKEYLMFYEDLN